MRRGEHARIIQDVDSKSQWNTILSVPFKFALSLNIDWFQSFKHINHSIVALYLSMQNLPRHERYASENILLVGVVPGPSKTMNDT